jgi:protein-tyrosine phosphatase
MSHIDYDGVGELYVTDITDARTTAKTNIDRVITTCQDSIEANVSDTTTYSHYCMSDGRPEVEEKYGGSCEYELFETSTDELYDALTDDERVLIHCHRGQSRSVSVATAALGRLLDKPRSEALDTVHHYRPVFSYPDKLLMEHADRYIVEHGGRGMYELGDSP